MMKILLSTLLLLLCLSSYASAAEITAPEIIAPFGYDDFTQRMELRETNALDPAFLESLHDFSQATTLKIIGQSEGNLCYSPASLYFALALLGNGAQGKTQAEILQVLALKDMDDAYLREQAGRLYRLLRFDNEVGACIIANSLWIDQSIACLPLFAEQAARDFYASIFSADFSDPATADAMQAWVLESTKGFIRPQISIDPSDVLALMNTLYFKDEWVDAFSESQTQEDIFTQQDGTEISCDFMRRMISFGSYQRGKGFVSVSLPLKNQSSMTFYLPDEGLSPSALDIWSDQEAHDAEIHLKIPKFDYNSETNLAPILQALGLQRAFAADADFSAMAESGLFVSGVRQQAHIAIDENGVEAAAFTEIFMAGAGLMEEKEVLEFYLDRPFLYTIESNDGILLFIGVVENPAAASMINH